MLSKMFLVVCVVTSATLVLGQRPSFAGFRPIGYPELEKTDELGNRFGESDGTTPKLPIEANGDLELIDQLSKLPIDRQPFWFINWQALEAHRNNPQTYPQRPNPFANNLNVASTSTTQTSVNNNQNVASTSTTQTSVNNNQNVALTSTTQFSVNNNQNVASTSTTQTNVNNNQNVASTSTTQTNVNNNQNVASTSTTQTSVNSVSTLGNRFGSADSNSSVINSNSSDDFNKFITTSTSDSVGDKFEVTTTNIPDRFKVTGADKVSSSKNKSTVRKLFYFFK